MSDLKSPWSVHVDHQTSPGRFDVFSSEGYLVAVATTGERAKLICAAPELLEALQWMKMALNSGTAMDIAIGQEKADAAITKALGQ